MSNANESICRTNFAGTRCDREQGHDGQHTAGGFSWGWVEKEKMCLAPGRDGVFICTELCGHHGDHIARGMIGSEYFRWPKTPEAQTDRSTVAPDEPTALPCKLDGACKSLGSVKQMCLACQARWHRSTADKIEAGLRAGENVRVEPRGEPTANLKCPCGTATCRYVIALKNSAVDRPSAPLATSRECGDCRMIARGAARGSGDVG